MAITGLCSLEREMVRIIVKRLKKTMSDAEVLNAFNKAITDMLKRSKQCQK